MGNVFRATNSSNNNGYTMAVEFKEVKETFPEDYFNQNEEMDQARFVSLNKTYYGVRTLGEEAEWFKFTLKTNSKVSIPLTDNTYCDIYNSSKEKIKSEYGYHGFYQQLELKKGTSYTVKGLKGKKKYYVRVRSYKKSGSKTLYSAWSKKKSVKTKK